MNFDKQLLFFFSALGAFNSSLLSVYFFFFSKPKKTSNYFLGLLLAVLSIRIWKSIFFYFNPELSKIYLQIGLSACLFIGPLMYFYIKIKTSNLKRAKNHWYYQLAFLLLFVVVIGYLYPYQKYPELWGDYFYKFINYQWLALIIVSALLLKDVFIKVLDKNKQLDHNDIWVLSVFVGIFMIWAAYFTASYTSYITGALSFSFTLYLAMLLIFYQRKKNFIVSEKKEKYAGNKIDENEAKHLLKTIEAILNEKELFKNPDLTLPQLAKETNVRTHLLSQLLNDNLNKSFSQFINEYRIREAKKLLKSDINLKTEIIAEMCGYNSNSTFYAAFKKVTNTTPAKFIRK
jgi:AraC-like DNA-binding protein